MALEIQGQVGPQNLQDGAVRTLRIDRQGSGNVSELHGRFYEQTFRGNVYVGGMALTSLVAATFTVADALSGTLGTAALSTPIVGLWNPSTSGVNAVILQAIVSQILTAATSTGTGPLIWVSYAGQVAAISTGLNPVNRKTFASPGGSVMKNLAGVALTGLQNTGVSLFASAMPVDTTNFSFVGTAAGAMTFAGPFIENVDGSIIVPPGGVLGLFATGTPAAVSAASALIWEEVPA